MVGEVQLLGVENAIKILDSVPRAVNRTALKQTLGDVGKPLRLTARQKLRALPGGKRLAKDVKIWPVKYSPFPGKWVGWKLNKKASGKGRRELMWNLLGPLWLEYGTSGVGVKNPKYKSKDYHRIAPYRWFKRSVRAEEKNMKNSFKKAIGLRTMAAMNKYNSRIGL